MTNAMMTALAAGLWIGGAVATGVLAFELNRAGTLPKATVDTTPPQVTLSPIPPDPPAEPTLILLPNNTIVGTAPAPKLRAATTKPHVMHCSDWRPLEQGSNSVQLCE